MKRAVLIFCLLSHLSLCFAQDELRILPLGNSLTYGWYDGTYSEGARVSYRYRLYELLNNAGYNYSFVGHISSGYNSLPFTYARNGGIPGIRISQLISVIEEGWYYNPNTGSDVDIVFPRQPYLNVYNSDLILLHIGTNDIDNGSINPSGISDILDAIDEYESSFNTEVLVLVAKVISTKHSSGSCTSNSDVTQFNNSLQTIINSRISAGDKVILVDMQCDAGIDYNSDMLNSLHPAQSGYNKMGDKWFEVIDDIHGAPVISAISVPSIQEGQNFPDINLDSYVSDDYTPDNQIDWSIVGNPVNLNVSITADNRLLVSPKSSDWGGSETITLAATDKGRYIEKLKKTSTIDVEFTIDDQNDAPIILSQITMFNLMEDQEFSISLSDLEIEDVDNSIDELSLNIKPGDNYSFTGNTISPSLDFTGTLHVNLSVSDPELESDNFILEAYFNPINDKPIILGSEPITLMEGEELLITKSLLEIYDPDNSIEDLTLIVLGGNYYTVNGQTIKPHSGFSGDLSVNVYVTDFEEPSELYAIPITVELFNQPPVFITQLTDTTAIVHQQFYYEIVATDPNDDIVNYLNFEIPGFLTFIEASGILIGTPNSSDKGSYQVSIGASDGIEIAFLDFDLTVKSPDFSEGLNGDTEFSVYPVPARNSLNISSEYLTMIEEIMIADIYGRIMSTQSSGFDVNTNLTVDISALPSGSYFLKIFIKEKVVVKKFVVSQN